MLVLVVIGGLLTMIYPPPGSSMPIHLRWVDGATVGFFLGCLGCLVCSKFLSRDTLRREHIGTANSAVVALHQNTLPYSGLQIRTSGAFPGLHALV